MGQTSNQDVATSFPFALVQTTFQYTLSTNPSRKGWQNESSAIFLIFFLGAAKGCKWRVLYSSSYTSNIRGMRWGETESRYSGISATGKLACLSFFAPGQCLSPRYHCSRRLRKRSNCPGKKEQSSCRGLGGKALCKERKEEQGLCSYLGTPTAHQL